MQKRRWHTVVALVVVECVRLVGAVAELENAGTKGIAACVLCGGGLINWASKSAAGIAGCMVVAKDVQAIQQVKHQCGRCSKLKLSNS